jgi:hypothetical protein
MTTDSYFNLISPQIFQIIRLLHFGELNGYCSFELSNAGESSLIIQNVKISYGSTVSPWTQKPIKSGKNGEIEISYDTSHPGIFSKTITVFYNGQDSSETLTINGCVTFPRKHEL